MAGITMVREKLLQPGDGKNGKMIVATLFACAIVLIARIIHLDLLNKTNSPYD